MARWLQIAAGVSVAALALVYGFRFLSCNRPISADKLAEQALTDPAPEQQQQAAATLVALPQEARREPLRRLVRESTSPQVRATAILGLAGQWDYDSMPRMLELLDDPSPDVRAAAGSAAQRLMSVDFGFRGTDSPEKREVAAAQLRKQWESFRDSWRLKWWKERLANDELDGRVLKNE